MWRKNRRCDYCGNERKAFAAGEPREEVQTECLEQEEGKECGEA